MLNTITPTQATLLPNGAVHITDDAYIEAALINNGYLDKLCEMPGKNFVGWTWQNELAYCLATRDYGHLLPKDNGYSLIVMPRAHFTDAQASAFVHAVCTSQAVDATSVNAIGPIGN